MIMKRADAIKRYFQKVSELTVSKKAYRKHLTELFGWMIQADAVTDDIASNTLAISGKGMTQIVSKQAGVIAGIAEVAELLKMHTSLEFLPSIKDGNHVNREEVVAEVRGDNTEILAYERAILNILGRMSGIATETARLVVLLHGIPDAPAIAAIRKTPLMMLDKKAVAVGGGMTHRLSLADSILIKDNHLGMLQKELGLETSEQAAEEAVKRCMQSKEDYFEIEADTLSQANAILHTFVKENTNFKNSKMMAILLDNFRPMDAKQFVESLKKLSIYDSVLIEASGEITAENIVSWAQTGVDVVSLGAITHSAKVFNFSMRY